MESSTQESSINDVFLIILDEYLRRHHLIPPLNTLTTFPLLLMVLFSISLSSFAFCSAVMVNR